MSDKGVIDLQEDEGGLFLKFKVDESSTKIEKKDPLVAQEIERKRQEKKYKQQEQAAKAFKGYYGFDNPQENETYGKNGNLEKNGK